MFIPEIPQILGRRKGVFLARTAILKFKSLFQALKKFNIAPISLSEMYSSLIIQQKSRNHGKDAFHEFLFNHLQIELQCPVCTSAIV